MGDTEDSFVVSGWDSSANCLASFDEDNGFLADTRNSSAICSVSFGLEEDNRYEGEKVSKEEDLQDDAKGVRSKYIQMEVYRSIDQERTGGIEGNLYEESEGECRNRDDVRGTADAWNSSAICSVGSESEEKRNDSMGSSGTGAILRGVEPDGFLADAWNSSAICSVGFGPEEEEVEKSVGPFRATPFARSCGGVEFKKKGLSGTVPGDSDLQLGSP